MQKIYQLTYRGCGEAEIDFTVVNHDQRVGYYLERTGQKSVSVEAGLMDMLNRMQSGRFKVFKHLQ